MHEVLGFFLAMKARVDDESGNRIVSKKFISVSKITPTLACRLPVRLLV
jgi:hypothetical protein